MKHQAIYRHSTKSTFFVLILILLLGAGSVAAHQESTSELLLPYFEVDLTGVGVTTFFSVTNSSPSPVEAEVIFYTNWGIEVLRTTIAIDGDAVFQADLRRWLVNGNVPGKALGAADLVHIQMALSGQASPENGLFYATEAGFNLAVGYVKIRLNGSPTERDILFGEYFILDDTQDFAQGDVLIPISQGEACPGLCTRHGIRFLAGGSFDSGTEIVIWSSARAEASESAEFPRAKAQADTLAYRENGEMIDHLALGFIPLQVIKVSELGLSSPFGWLDLLTDRNTFITLRLSASNRFSVGFQTSCLPPRQDDTTLTVIKKVINDDGGTLRPVDFELFIGNGRTRSGVAVAIAPGEYRVRENNKPYYTAGTWGGDCDEDGNVTLERGDHKVCMITNDDQPQARLKLIKHVDNSNGSGTLGPNDFDLQIGNQGVDSGEVVTLAPGTYTVSEAQRVGYVTAQGWGGDCIADGSDGKLGTVTLAAGDNKVCEITNTSQDITFLPRLTLRKTVVGGDLQPQDVQLMFSGQPDDPNLSSFVDEPMTHGIARDLVPGQYTVREENPTGYEPGPWGGDCAADGSVTITTAKTDWVCTITNTIRPERPTLKLIKQVVGGPLGVADFPLFIDGDQVASGQVNELDPGNFVASEQNQGDYIAGDWGGDCAADGSVSLAAGEHKVCVITNTFPERPTLKLIKQVVGGPLSVDDFPLFIGGDQVASGQVNELDPGNFVASEQNQGDYIAGDWGGDCAADGSVSLAAGEHKVCVITNIFPERPTLELIKQVVGGPLGVADFPLFINGQQVASGQVNELDPGNYTASEQNQGDYIAGDWGGDCAADGSISLAAGEHKVCVITNTYRGRPTLKLIKQVVGGPLGVADFPLFINGQQVASGQVNELDPGNYTASEQNQGDYIAGDWGGDCTADGTVSLAAGEHKVCEITNTYDGVTPDRMTGGGSVFTDDVRYTHGFELHCDLSHPNNLEINWGPGRSHRFHLTSLDSAHCSDDPAIVEAPPVAGFDTFVGTGTGRLNGVDGATITFTFTDAGEPGKDDMAIFTITPPDGGPAISVSGPLHNGNHQAHGR